MSIEYFLWIYCCSTGFTYRALSAKADDGSVSAPKKTKPAASVEKKRFTIPPDFRHVYPEFLPDPNINWRNSVREKLERIDLLDRRYLETYTRIQTYSLVTK